MGWAEQGDGGVTQWDWRTWPSTKRVRMLSGAAVSFTDSLLGKQRSRVRGGGHMPTWAG